MNLKITMKAYALNNNHTLFWMQYKTRRSAGFVLSVLDQILSLPLGPELLP
jgi:hypothetical protein